MKIVHVERLISVGKISKSRAWAQSLATVHRAIKAIDWPVGNGKFVIYPERGAKRGEGNGVRPIKGVLIGKLKSQGWILEQAFDTTVVVQPGPLDATRSIAGGRIAVEWETGNISSSHRAINKMLLGMQKGVLAGGILIVPTKELARYLTDRVGNYPELIPYFDLWRTVPLESGILEIIGVEHDDTSYEVPRIPKMTDGRALE